MNCKRRSRRDRKLSKVLLSIGMLMLLTMAFGLSAAAEQEPVWSPRGITAMPDGSLLIADDFQNVLWKVMDGNKSIYAGQPGQTGLYGEPLGGYRDGVVSNMQMKSPWDVIPYRDGYAVSDRENHVIRYIARGDGKTLIGSGNLGYRNSVGTQAVLSGPTGLAADEAGNLYIADTGNDVIRRMSPSGQVDTYVRGLSGPTGLYYHGGDLYVADTGNNRIVKVTNGTVSWLAGTGTEGDLDGALSEAGFSSPQGITVAADGTIYIADVGNGVVRKIQGDTVTTMPVSDELHPGLSMVSPGGLLVQGDHLYVCDSFARAVFVLPR